MQAPNVADDIARRSRADHLLGDVLLATLLVAGVLLVHPLSYVFHHPFWLDEAWVATLARAPLSRALSLSSSTPIGWLLLVRLVPGGRGEELRLVPLLFSMGEVAMAYAFARSLPWGSAGFARLAGLSVGLVVLLAPASLVRNDLKQYTADAFFALAILTLASRAERDPGTHTMVELAVGSTVAVFFSTTAAFVAAAVFAGLLCTSATARSRARLRSIVTTGLVVGAVVVAYFALVVIPHTNAALRAFWDDYYLPSSFPHTLSTAWGRLEPVTSSLAMPGLLAVVLFGTGCVVLRRLGRPALAVALPVLWAEMIVAGMARRYPFLDPRTSTFLLVVSLVTITIGVVGVLRILSPRWPSLATTAAVLATFLFLHNSVDYIRTRSIPAEDVRAATAYVASHRRPGDVIVVTLPSSYGFSYYWPGGHIRYLRDAADSAGFVTRVRGLRGVVYAGGLAPADTTLALRRALVVAREGPAGSRIWIIRSHLYDDEAPSWEHSFRALHLHPETKPVGAEPIWIITPTRPA